MTLSTFLTPCVGMGAAGDSVQDTRALRLADVAMAMGVKGTDVSRTAASLVVMDDSFATVAAVVAEGTRGGTRAAARGHATGPCSRDWGLMSGVQPSCPGPCKLHSGRLFYANLAKSVAYVTTSNVAEVVPFFVFLTVQLPLAVTTSLILCIDIGSDLWPAITFAYVRWVGGALCRGRSAALSEGGRAWNAGTSRPSRT